MWKKSSINRTVVNSSRVKPNEIQISIRRKKSNTEKKVFFSEMKSFVLLEKWKKFRRIEFHMWYQKKNKSFYHGKKNKTKPKNFLGDFILKWKKNYKSCVKSSSKNFWGEFLLWNEKCWFLHVWKMSFMKPALPGERKNHEPRSFTVGYNVCV